MSVLEKLQKLLGVAEDQAGHPEGATAAAIAQKLMREHAIEMADIPLATQVAVDPMEESGRPIGADEEWRNSPDLPGENRYGRVLSHSDTWADFARTRALPAGSVVSAPRRMASRVSRKPIAAPPQNARTSSASKGRFLRGVLAACSISRTAIP